MSSVDIGCRTREGGAGTRRAGRKVLGIGCMEDNRVRPLFLTVAGIGLLSVGRCLVFVTAALFATGAEPVKFAKPQMAVSIPDDTAELVCQAAESLYTLGSCLREGEDPFGPMADAARALYRVADRFPVLLREAG
jgi:hypothetical protein